MARLNLGKPHGNIISNSASVMCGTKSNLEVWFPEIALHLIDIDVGACHHMYNVVKKFLERFKGTLEVLLREIYRDFRVSADSAEYLQGIFIRA